MKTRKRAISTVLTTIIILVASVVLGSGVVLYGTSLFQSGTQQEAITVSGLKVWVHGTATDGLAWGAFAVRNSGDKVISVDKISVRGIDVPFSQWYPDTNATGTKLQQAMNFSGWSGVDGELVVTQADTNCSGSPTIEINIAAGEFVCADKANGPVGLEPGDGAIIYFQFTNGTLTSIDSGVSTSVSIFAGKTGAPLSITIASKL
jgi:hypothetical protein